jgi:hypothetical protein
MVEQNKGETKLQLFISCRKLKDVETFSKSDPFVEVFERPAQGNWSKLGQTEVIWNNLNPNFTKIFAIDYLFEEQKFLNFKVFDANLQSGLEVKGKQIGEAECSIGEIVGSKGLQVIKTLYLPGETKSTGNIILRAEEVSHINNDELYLHFSARNLEDRSCWYRLHNFKPMFVLSRIMENGVPQRIYTSEFQRGTNIRWDALTKSMHELCNSDLHRPILFELFDYFKNGGHKLIGSFEFSVLSITEEGRKQFDLIPPKGQKPTKPLGTVFIYDLQITKVYSFLDYVIGGCEISLIVAVDFTASNGHPASANSLHYVQSNGYNQYQSALHSVSEILLNYDRRKEVPVYGFGGKINRQLSHCFPLNFNFQCPSVNGLNGIMHAYRSALTCVELSGPTLFAQILSTAVSMSESALLSQQSQHYFILLILTDGEIHDMRETVDLVVRGSYSPLSIVIVGIGEENFESMQVLDADEQPLIDSKGRPMMRDIVQFVPFRNFGNSPTALAKEVLAEIPREVTNYFRTKNITPNDPLQAVEFDVLRTYTNSTDDTGEASRQVYGAPFGSIGMPAPTVVMADVNKSYSSCQFTRSLDYEEEKRHHSFQERNNDS